MSDKFLVLERTIQEDLRVLERLYGDLGDPHLETANEEILIVVAYRLHGLYSAFENIFRNIAAAFENHLDPSSWHRQALHVAVGARRVAPGASGSRVAARAGQLAFRETQALRGPGWSSVGAVVE
jgi:hypothetical protein